jgi:hypothetical protein
MKKMTIIGLALIAVGFLIGVALIGFGYTMMLSKDPANENVSVIISPGDEAEDLRKGNYLLWIEGDVTGPIVVRGPDGMNLTIEESSDSVSYGDIELYGEVEAKETGNYRFEYMDPTSSSKLYITEEFSKGTYTTLIFGGGGAGVLIMLIGVILIVVGRLRQKKDDKSSFFHEAPPPGAPPQQPPMNEGAGAP